METRKIAERCPRTSLLSNPHVASVSATREDGFARLIVDDLSRWRVRNEPVAIIERVPMTSLSL